MKFFIWGFLVQAIVIVISLLMKNINIFTSLSGIIIIVSIIVGEIMPEGTKVHRCVQKVMKTGKAKPNAIRICQASTGQSYKTGRKPKRRN